MANWMCIQGCGACCNLDPRDRPDLEDYLTPDDLALYLSLVGEDGWCIHYDSATRQCRIYDDRPSFCRVQPDTFEAMFGIAPEDLNDFAIACCQEQISGVYGEDSSEMASFCTQVGLDSDAESSR